MRKYKKCEYEEQRIVLIVKVQRRKGSGGCEQIIERIMKMQKKLWEGGKFLNQNTLNVF